MKKKKSFAVIGLGQFGFSIVNELVKNGADVIAIDNDRERVQKVSAFLKTVFIADSTDEKALEQLGIRDVDAAIVAYGDNKEASVLTTVILKDMGIKQIVVRCDDEYYVPIMKRLGATEIITPQKAAGIALANRIGSIDYKDFYKLDDEYSVVSISVNSNYSPQTLMQLNPKSKFGVNIVLIKRANKSTFVPGGEDSILPDDEIFAVGTTQQIKSFREAINGKDK